MDTTKEKISTLNYFGGKSRLLDFILPLLDTPHKHYVEPFCGSASVFLNKRPSPIETISDLDARLINFFRVLREQPDELINRLDLTPYSRGEFQFCSDPCPDDLVEDARRYFVRCMQSFGGMSNATRRINSWRTNFKESRRGVSMEVSKWMNKIDRLPELVNRLRSAQIENRDFRYLIPKCNDKDTLLYCDPPYLHQDRTGDSDYYHEMNLNDQLELSQLLNTFKGKVAISGYESSTMDKLYPSSIWTKHIGPPWKSNLGKSSKKREAVYTNYKPSTTIRIAFD